MSMITHLPVSRQAFLDDATVQAIRAERAERPLQTSRGRMDERMLLRLTQEFGAHNLSHLCKLLTPGLLPRRAFLGPESDTLLTSFVERGLVELNTLIGARGIRQVVRLTTLGHDVAMAIKPPRTDYVIERGSGAPQRPCRVCGAVPTHHSVFVRLARRVHTPWLEQYFFCDRHLTDAAALYRELRAVYVTGIPSS